ncbi:MAG TPA: PadR family transcriptional regulator [Candidatus Saccharimonadales bacterium]|nr:PadR family transcriptional regulator [Candidatus Saccharimonadales bacterium]
MDTSELLSRTAFSILLALSLKPRHGYELMQQVEHDTAGRIKLGPGALYGTVKQLVDAHLIEEMPFEGTERRRYYRLTRKGWDRLGAEMQYYEQTVRLGHERQVLPADRGAFAWMTN